MRKNFYVISDACEEIAKHVQFDRCYRNVVMGHQGEAYYFNMGQDKNVADWFPGLPVSIHNPGRDDPTPALRRRVVELPDRFKTVILQTPSAPDYNPVARAVLREKLKPAVTKIFGEFDSLSREDAMEILLKALVEK